ncbi:Zn-ribbon domain-containing OB-fold protein [Streptomyces smyrnaeus]|uniref:Zn-ribbon domain-containing OB-fold protein n=1 Tax=Streptomyces TaxID=1883 RepID=UPI000C197314|nr:MULTISPECIES: OB-fold domain-containing protein [unclassified Streptomyces]MBQ0867718.1 OB-fold domain-containing protein [Streptomyces sp. RK75]MBQ1120446.1 OB-fold domain-containing protein [Streptomyces sp. B15]MBQ1159067.1 OB-fold domain-containing protein [Streptomyces sp. A73]
MTTAPTGPPETGLLLPEPDDDGAPFWSYAADGELRVQTCSDCGRRRFPPRPCCPRCRSFEAEWQRMSGRGRIWSYVVAHPPLLPGYAEAAPYNVLVVELADDPAIRLVGNLVATPHAPLGSMAAGKLRVGAPVRAVFREVGDGERRMVLPRWVLERP